MIVCWAVCEEAEGGGGDDREWSAGGLDLGIRSFDATDDHFPLCTHSIASE